MAVLTVGSGAAIVAKYSGEQLAEIAGGGQRILNLCGTDGIAEFRGQHGSAALPNDRLTGFRIGRLG